MKMITNALKRLASLMLRTLLVFIVVEGICSVWLTALRGWQMAGSVRAGGRNAQFDPDLGWVNIPNFNMRDLYGPGGHTRTNSRGFRNAEEFEAKIPEGRIRILCSGDSFVFGYGVDNDHANCNLLAAENTHLETVNMGIPGYGLDQMYLLYKREGLKLDHDVHLIAVIKEDLTRMAAVKFLDANKPVIRLRNGALVVGNVPVQRSGYSMPEVTRALSIFDATRFMTLYRTLFPGTRPANVYGSENELVDTAVAIFEDLARLATERNAILVVAYLPMAGDVEDAAVTQAYLSAELARRNVVFVDLTPEFRAVPVSQRAALFIPRRARNEPFAAGHYSRAGNLFVAGAFWKRISALPAVSGKLARLAPSAPR